jgi:hypothetical protein
MTSPCHRRFQGLVSSRYPVGLFTADPAAGADKNGGHDPRQKVRGRLEDDDVREGEGAVMTIVIMLVLLLLLLIAIMR